MTDVKTYAHIESSGRVFLFQNHFHRRRKKASLVAHDSGKRSISRLSLSVSLLNFQNQVNERRRESLSIRYANGFLFRKKLPAYSPPSDMIISDVRPNINLWTTDTGFVTDTSFVIGRASICYLFGLNGVIAFGSIQRGGLKKDVEQPKS